MRPLELELRNFRSYYGDGAIFDLRGRRLVGIVGPIGSGKSSILDAIAFALYGKTPTIAAATKSLIHQRADGATVALRFEVEGEIWQVVRALRRKGQSQHTLTRLATDSSDAEELERIVLEADVNARIIELLGLGFDAFSRSVLLAQGRFAEFLKSRPADRDKVLKGVFGHDRIDAMRDIAKSRAAETSVDLERTAVRIEELERTQERLIVSKSSLTEAEQRIELLRKAEPRLDDFAERETTARQQLNAALERLGNLELHAGRLPDPDASQALLEEAASAEIRRAELAAEIDEAQRALVEAETVHESATQEGEQLISRAADLLTQRNAVATRAKDIASRVSDLAERMTVATDTAQDAVREAKITEGASLELRSAVEARQADVTAAAAAVHDARHADMAAALQGELSAGEPCPVCAQIVADVPPPETSELAVAEQQAADAARALDAARRDYEQAEQAVAAHRELVAKSSAIAEGLQAELEAARSEQRETTQLIDESETELRAMLGSGDPAALIAARRAEFKTLGDAAASARKRVDRVRGEHDEAIVVQQNAARRLADLRLQLAELSTRLELATDIPEDAGLLEPVVTQLLTAWAETTRNGEASRDAATTELESIESDRKALLADIDLSADFATELASALARAEMLAAEVDAAEQTLDAADELIASHRASVETRDAYEKIAGDLTNSGFIRFLLDDERARLAELGSEHFERLSSGRYRFATDGSFDVVDLTSADAIRKSDSLSGGETFVASLGLALALAEMVTRTGGRLDAFFIDEGFGSLDPEHLDLAMDGIEALAAEGDSRLVVVVSHVSELRQRIEDLIELDRDSMTGDTRIVRA